jgi:hypothetical protein
MDKCAVGPEYETDEMPSELVLGPRDAHKPGLHSTGDRFEILAAEILNVCDDSMVVEIYRFINQRLEAPTPPLDCVQVACTADSDTDALREALLKQIVVSTCDPRSLMRLNTAFKWSTGVDFI